MDIIIEHFLKAEAQMVQHGDGEREGHHADA